jgi:hypothetical protein
MKPIAVVLLAAAFVAAGEGTFDRNSLLQPGKTMALGTGGLLDPSRFSVSQSYSMSFSSGSGGESWDGLYLSTLSYQLAVPVTLSLDLGLAHQPGALFKAGPMNRQFDASAVVMPRLELKYQPFRNTLIRVQYLNSKGLSSRSPYYWGDFDRGNLLLTPNQQNEH